MLYSKQWEARVAAGVCFGLVAEHTQHHTAAELRAAAGGSSGTGRSEASACIEGEGARFGLEEFSLDRVLEQGSALVQSGGQVCSCSRSLPRGHPLLNVIIMNHSMAAGV